MPKVKEKKNLRPTVNEIKKNIDIVKFLSRHVTLTKSKTKYKGKLTGNYEGFCPICNCETGKFFLVSPKANYFHCFNCRSSGDIFTFIMSYRKVEFIEALKEILGYYQDQLSKCPHCSDVGLIK